MDNYMYGIIKNIIENEAFDLSDIIKNISKNNSRGMITDEQEEELIELARQFADTTNSIKVLHKLEEFDRRIKVIEEKINSTEDVSGPTAEYAEYVAGKWYYAGDKVSFGGNNYICCAPEGQVCTWSPSEYPAYWEKQ